MIESRGRTSIAKLMIVAFDLLKGDEHDAVPATQAEENRIETFEEG